jgi:hypothetical protein
MDAHLHNARQAVKPKKILFHHDVHEEKAAIYCRLFA